jgi:hypothetical protein
MHFAPILRAATPMDEPLLLQTVYQFHGAVMEDLQAFRKVRDARQLAWRNPFERKHELMLLRFHASLVRHFLAEMHEAPNPVTKFGESPIGFDLNDVRVRHGSHHSIIS